MPNPCRLPFRLIERLERWAIPDFAYVRWLGPRELTDYSRVQINRDQELAEWAPCIVDTRNALSGIATRPGQLWKA